MVGEEVVERAPLPHRHPHAKSAKAWRGLCALARLWLPSLVVGALGLNCQRNSPYYCRAPIAGLRLIRSLTSVSYLALVNVSYHIALHIYSYD